MRTEEMDERFNEKCELIHNMGMTVKEIVGKTMNVEFGLESQSKALNNTETELLARINENTNQLLTMQTHESRIVKLEEQIEEFTEDLA